MSKQDDEFRATNKTRTTRGSQNSKTKQRATRNPGTRPETTLNPPSYHHVVPLTRVHPAVVATALTLADGDARRLRTQTTTCVIVVNHAV